LLKPSEAAARLGVSPKTVLRYIHDAKLEAIQTPGGDYRIPELALTTFLRMRASQDGEPSSATGPRVMALTNQKGGVGKTTTAVNLAVELATRGEQVLLIDADPQANATRHLGLNPYQLERSLYDVMHNPGQGAGLAIVTVGERLDLLPATLDMAALERELNSVFERERILKRALGPVLGRYTYILIDCPPALGLLTLNALMAATEVLIPLQVEPFAVHGMAQLQETIDIVQSGNPALRIGGVVCTMYDSRNNLSEAIERAVRDQFGADVYTTVIPRNVALSEASGAGQPIQAYDSSSRGAGAYRALAEEVIARG
jgi:chromosome partitioning protein